MTSGKRYLVVLAAFALVGALASPAAAQPKMKGPKYRLAVVEFRDEFSGVGTTASGYGNAWVDAMNNYKHMVNTSYPGAGSKTIGAGAAKMLETALAKSGMFDMFTRAEMDKVLKEQALGQTGMVTQQSAAKAGQLTGVNVIVVGAVTEFGEKAGGVNVFFLAGGQKTTARVVIDVQLIDTTTGKIVKALSAVGEEANTGVSLFVVSGGTSMDDTKVGKAMRKAVNTLVDQVSAEVANIPWSAKIVKADAANVYVNGGVNTNLQPGMKFLVYRAGEELIDPDTGESLGKEETLSGEIMITQVLEKVSKAVPVSGSGFTKGDVVRLKE
ncbi:MAG: CsgG/HfaB family protein [Comamonadaceae bacterium]|nr:CsgG/HfaB family protein [Comamonadaceae bacterium]